MMYSMLQLLFFVIVIYFLIVFIFDIIEDVKFQNEILDLDTEKQYSLNEIKSIFLDTYKKDLDGLNEYYIKHMAKLIEQVKGNLLKKETQYYKLPMMNSTLFKIFNEQKIYKNDKQKLLNILSSILEELKEEKKFFGLNTREREILISLSKNENLSDVDKRSILELKDIVTNRYQELLKKNEQSNVLSKRSMKLGYISLIVTFITSYDYIKIFILKFFA